MSVLWVLRLVLLSVACKVNFANECRRDQFPCNNGDCIDKLKWCDTAVDCEDDSDELYCYTRTPSRPNPNRCNETFFLCNDGRCIPSVGRCDGFLSCLDHSDEDNCGTTHVHTDLPKTEAVHFTLSISEKSRSPRQLEPPNAYDLVKGNSSAPVYQSDFWNATDLTKTLQEHSDHNRSLDTSSLSDVDDDLGMAMTWGAMTTEALLKAVASTVNSVEVKDTTDQSENSKHTQKQELPPVVDSYGNIVPHDVFLKYVDRRNKAKTNHDTHNSSTEMRLDVSDANNTSVQDDPSDFQNVTSKGSLKIGFSKLSHREYRRERTNAQQWLFKVRDEDYGWGVETARAIVALYMSDSEWMDKHLNEKHLTSNSLHLKLFTALIRNQTKRISLGELSLYVNALSASCSDPRNFYGQDLIQTLRYRTDAAQASSGFVTPLVYLSLCLNNASMFEDLRKLQDMVYGNSTINKIDIIALASLAATCISGQPVFSTYGLGHNIAKTLYERVVSEGLPKNIYELGLVIQALNEAQINHNLWNRSDAMKAIAAFQNNDGSFGDILSTYYAVPTLSGKSLVSLGEHCPQAEDDGLIPLEVLNNGENEKKYVHYSLYFGDPVEMSQSLMMKVPKSSNFLDIMRIAETVNPIYKFRYDMSNKKPTVYSIGGIVNDAEQGLYWTLHVSSQQNSTEKNLVPYENDIRFLVPELGDYVVFWRKRAF